MLAEAQAPQWCEGRVRTFLTSTDGAVLVMPSFLNDWIQVCNISNAWKGVPTNICNFWVAYLATALGAQRDVTITYSSAPACSQLQLYDAAPAPVYINLRGE